MVHRVYYGALCTIVTAMTVEKVPLQKAFYENLTATALRGGLQSQINATRQYSLFLFN